MGNKGSVGQEGEFPCKKCGRSVMVTNTAGGVRLSVHNEMKDFARGITAACCPLEM